MTDEELYEAIVKFAEESQGAEVSDDQIKGIRYRESDPKYDKDVYDIEVGDTHPISGEPVEAIRRALCTGGGRVSKPTDSEAINTCISGG